MVTDSAMVTLDWRAYKKPPSFFRMVPSLTAKWRPQMHPQGPTSRRVLPPGNYDRISTRQLCAVPDIIMSRAISHFAKLLWPLF